MAQFAVPNYESSLSKRERDMSKRLENNLTEGSILQKLIAFATPILLGNILQTLYSLVDTLVVGQFEGTVGISAVTVGSQLTFLLTTVGMGFANGGQIVIAQLKGADDERGQREVIGALLTMSAIGGVLVGVLGVGVHGLALKLFNTPAESWVQAKDYMIITSAGLIFVFLYNATSCIMRGLGDSTRPLLFIAIASVSNIILDVIFVGPLGMGAAGAAWATVAAQALSAAFGFVFLYRRRDRFVFDFKRESFALKRKWVSELCRMGIPMMIQMSAINLSMSVMMSLVNVYGLAASATLGIGNKITQVCCMPYHAMSTAGSAMCGQNIGAGKHDRVKKVVSLTLLINLVITAVTTVVIFLIPEQLVAVFDKDPQVIELCTLFLKLHVINNSCQGLFSAFNSSCLGCGNAPLSTVAFLTDGVVLRLSLCLIFTYLFHMGLFGLFLANAIAPVGAALILGIYHYSGKWRSYQRGAARAA